MSEVQYRYAQQECIIHSNIGRHDNIVELFHYTESKDEFVLLMEYCNDAGYFEDKIEQVRFKMFKNLQRFTPIKNQDKLISYSSDILVGLSHLHQQGIIHSDLKIQNALLQRPEDDESQAGEYPTVKLCDFGLSHLMNSEGRALMTDRCGTGGYIAPEVKPKNTMVGPEIDMWAFGVMLYEMCTAYKPTKLSNYRYGKFYL